MPTLDELVNLVRQLSPLEKLLLIERLAPDLEAVLRGRHAPDGPGPTAHRSLRGLLRGCNIGADDIAQVRQEMWGGFPREGL